jgi:hypothetical protein
VIAFFVEISTHCASLPFAVLAAACAVLLWAAGGGDAQPIPVSFFNFLKIDANTRATNLSTVGVPAAQPANFLTVTDKTPNQNVSADFAERPTESGSLWCTA